jgi:hypothetical protein
LEIGVHLFGRCCQQCVFRFPSAFVPSHRKRTADDGVVVALDDEIVFPGRRNPQPHRCPGRRYASFKARIGERPSVLARSTFETTNTIVRPITANLEVPLNRSFIRVMAFFGIVALAACQGGGGGTVVPVVPGGAQQAPAVAQPLVTGLISGDGEIPLASPNAVRQVCPRASYPGEMQCFALERTDLRADTVDANVTPQGYGPSDLQKAYKIPAGNGTLVAIVAAYGYPNAARDLGVYRSYYKLPACTTSSGCLRIRNQVGGTKPPVTNPSWDAEQALDLDMVSAACPQCKILLVQANTNSGSNLYNSVAEAARLGAHVISNSYGGSEYGVCQGGGEGSDSRFSQPGHVYVASSGDNGGGLNNCGGPQQPCALATVVCAGGTHLMRFNNSRGWKETVWNELASPACGFGGCGAAGSGCSIIVKKPSWQNDTGCKRRSESDVSAEASVLTPVAVYVGGWTAFGGTSVSAPLISGIFGRAGNAESIDGPHNVWYHRSKLFDVTFGNNLDGSLSGPCASTVHYICTAGAGFDGPTGWGSPNGLGAF